MYSASSGTIADAIRALEDAKSEKEAVDRLAAEAAALTGKAAKLADAAEAQARAASTPERRKTAQQKLTSARAVLQRAEAVRRSAKKTAAQKALAERAAEEHLAAVRAEAKRAGITGTAAKQPAGAEAKESSRAVPKPHKPEKTEHLRWFPAVVIPLIFALILATAVNTASQANFAAAWNAVSSWYSETLAADNGSGQAKQAAEENAGEETESNSDTLTVGQTAATDLVQVTLNDVCFSDVVLFTHGNWLNPAEESGVTAEDGCTFVCFSFTIKNLSVETFRNSALCNVTVNYNGSRCTGAEYGFEADSGTGSDASVSADLVPQASRNYFGYISCPAEVKTGSSAQLTVNFMLPASGGDTEVAFDCSGKSADINEETAAVAEALQSLLTDLTTIRDHAGETDADGSRAFDTEIISRTRNALKGVDEAYVEANLPETAARLPLIQQNLKSICDKLEVMSISNSAGNVEKIRSLSNRTLAMIQALFDTELKDYAES